ncbi:MAG: hypothetical protein E7563_02925 [Ruminococcaceae bacterium]|nr:hypothetical protein [Oscillospiraceae bacterium]
MEKSHRMPHALIITGGDDTTRQEFAEFLCKWSVCTSDHSPCGECAQCRKAEGKNHIDIYYAKGKGKTNGIPVEEIREIIKDTAIKPNEAKRKVYVLYDADKRMGKESMNAFLKTLEEPSQDILFILTAENLKAVPVTILSRCTCLTLESSIGVSDKTMELAEGILLGIISSSELDLLKALGIITTRQVALEVLPVVRTVLGDTLSLSVGAEGVFDSELPMSLRKKLTKNKIIRLIDVTSDAINKTNRNVNLTILTTWLCGEYRRISWQM